MTGLRAGDNLDVHAAQVGRSGLLSLRICSNGIPVSFSAALREDQTFLRSQVFGQTGQKATGVAFLLCRFLLL